MHIYLRYLYSFLYRKSVIYSKCFYRAFFEELGPFKVREPSAKGRRAAATKEEDEVGSNSSSNGSGVPGPAEKVTFLSKSFNTTSSSRWLSGCQPRRAESSRWTAVKRRNCLLSSRPSTETRLTGDFNIQLFSIKLKTI